MVIIKMKHPKHEDERGYFRELVKFEQGFPLIKQISKFTINPDKQRGNHFHKYTWEVFIVESGTVKCTLHSFVKNETKEEILEEGDGRVLIVGPMVNHTFYSEKGCEIIVLSSKVFNPQDPDTYVY